MRRIITTGLLALSLVAVTALGAAAQDDPAATAITPAGLNADKIDGRHAVGHGASVKKRAGKLVATNKRGQLPSNIVKPAWRLILGKPAAFADGKITWGEVQDKPGALADGQIGWGEVKNKPDGFADGVDNKGITSVTITTRSVLNQVSGPAGAGGGVTVGCLGSSQTIGGGFDTTEPKINVKSSHLQSSGHWKVSWSFIDDLAALTDIHVYAICMST